MNINIKYVYEILLACLFACSFVGITAILRLYPGPANTSTFIHVYKKHHLFIAVGNWNVYKIANIGKEILCDLSFSIAL